MTTDDPVKAAEKRGYARGYVAGQKRVEREDREAERGARKERFRRQAFLAALPSCVLAQNWKLGDRPIETVDDRTKLAWSFANKAVEGTRF